MLATYDRKHVLISRGSARFAVWMRWPSRRDDVAAWLCAASLRSDYVADHASSSFRSLRPALMMRPPHVALVRADMILDYDDG